MDPNVRGDDLDGHVRALSHLDQVNDLFPHDVPPTHQAAEHHLIQNYPKGRRLVTLQDFPPLQPGIDLFVDLVFRGAEAGPENRPRVVAGLQQTWHQNWAEPAELLRLALTD